ncbi:hypothetical protein [Myxosarcina sp. GI1]|uniref:hypothetical protein n=1 Tax=Myxosarcina sp. GI1 TaxID=1541065 RepID=UPI00155AC1AD
MYLGGSGRDNLKAETGNDILYGGTGGDRLRKNEGNDVFVLTFGDEVRKLSN